MAYGDLPAGAPHKPNKGLEGGACNRERCQAEPALWYNHGSFKWYCADCARDIGQDHVNLRDWNLRWRPECGHDQFETREMMDRRKAQRTAEAYSAGDIKVGQITGCYPNAPAVARKPSASLERLLGRRPRRGTR